MENNESLEFKLGQDFVALQSIVGTLKTEFAVCKVNEVCELIDSEVKKLLKSE